jgi:AraC-like DNA-binding protein
LHAGKNGQQIMTPNLMNLVSSAAASQAAPGCVHDSEYLRHRPAPPLDECIDYLWSLRDAPPHPKERIVPSGTVELVVNLVEDEIRVYGEAESASAIRHPGSVVSGAFSRPFVIDTREHASIVGVHFKPGGAFHFLPAPLAQLANCHVGLESLWSVSDVRRLRERLCAAPTPAARFTLLEDALRAHLFRPPEAGRAVRVALQRMLRPDVSVRAVADAVGLSHRRFIEVFSRSVGMTPKLFLRVQRFQRALALAGQEVSTQRWSELASGTGYFDQSHLIRDFVAFAGLSPVEYLRRSSARV